VSRNSAGSNRSRTIVHGANMAREIPSCPFDSFTAFLGFLLNHMAMNFYQKINKRVTRCVLYKIGFLRVLAIMIKMDCS